MYVGAIFPQVQHTDQIITRGMSDRQSGLQISDRRPEMLSLRKGWPHEKRLLTEKSEYGALVGFRGDFRIHLALPVDHGREKGRGDCALRLIAKKRSSKGSPGGDA